MKVVGTVATKPTARIVNTKKDGPRVVHEMAVLDEDGGIVSIQKWAAPDDKSEPFAGADLGATVEAQFSNPTLYQGVTRVTLAGSLKTR